MREVEGRERERGEDGKRLGRSGREVGRRVRRGRGYRVPELWALRGRDSPYSVLEPSRDES